MTLPSEPNFTQPPYLHWHRPDGTVVGGWLVRIMEERTTQNGVYIGVFVEETTGQIREAPVNELTVTPEQMELWGVPGAAP